jgi:quinol monooxygenase YgiN
MNPVTVINRIVVNPGQLDAFIEAQQKFARTMPRTMLVGGRMYRSVDGASAVLVSKFPSKSAQEEVLQSTAFKEHLRGLQAFVESSTPILYEEAYTTGDFR